MILKELLSQYEIENNLSHKEMAQLLNVSTSTYYRWLSGESTKLKKTTINKLSDIFDCDIEGVLEETNRLKPILGKVKAGFDLWADHERTPQVDYLLRLLRHRTALLPDT